MNKITFEEFRRSKYLLPSTFFIYDICDPKYVPLMQTSHDYYEVLLHITGRVDYRVDMSIWRLQPFDIVLIPPEVTHKPNVDFQIPFRRILLCISRQWISQMDNAFSSEESLSECFYSESPLLRLKSQFQSHAFTLMSEAASMAQMEGSEADWKSQLRAVELLIYLRKCQTADHSVKSIAEKTDRELMIVNQYIDTNMKKAISVDSLASLLKMSRTSLFQMFKEKINVSPNYYIRQRKMMYAHSLMREGESLEYVSYACGYETYSSFYRAFCSIYGVSPRDYLKLSQ